MELFEHYAQQYQDKYFDVSLYAESLDFLKGNLRNRDSVLDIGAGPGNVARYLLDARPGLRYLAADLSPKMLELARANNSSIKTIRLDCRDIAGMDERFDCIVSSFCIPYLNPAQTRQFIVDAHARLQPKGHLYLSWTGAGVDRQENKTSDSGLSVSVHYYAQPTIESLLDGRFEILHAGRYLSYNKADTDLVLIARKI